MNIASHHHELAILVRAVAFPNLSTASSHIGVSQPQLSRVVQKLEEALGLPLLDRTARRKSGWTRQALEIAEAYARAAARMDAELAQVLEEGKTDSLRVGTLEGCIPYTNRMLARLLDALPLRRLEIDVEDVGGLEEQFLKGRLDVILSLRSPGRKKYRHELELGTQRLEQVKRRFRTGREVQLLSSFEAATQSEAAREGALQVVSNSLAVKRHWLEELGGESSIPGDLQKRKLPASEPHVTIWMVGSELLSQSVWNSLASAARSAQTGRRPIP